MKKTTNRNFKNILLLSFRDETLTNLYYKSIYQFSQILIVSLITYSLVIANTILLNAIEENTNKSGIKQLQIILLILEGVLIVSFIIWKKLVDRPKKTKLFFWINFTMSMMSLFNICFQPFILRDALEEIGSSFVLNSIIPDTQFALIFLFLLFIDNSFFIYLVDVVISIAIFYSLSLFKNSKENIYQPVVLSLGGIFFILVAYFVNKRDKNHFILYNDAINEVEKKKSLFDNLNSGLIVIDKDGCDFNLKIKEYLNTSFQKEVVNSSNIGQNTTIKKSEINNNDSCFKFNNNMSENLKIKSLLFRSYREYNPSLYKNVKEIFERKLSFDEDNDEKEIQYDRMLNDLLNMMKSKEIYKSYFYVGDKLIGKPIRKNSNFHRDSVTLRIYIRYNNVSSSLEFFLNDISSVIEEENQKASYKYKKLFLNKFSHEFKNPLLNILQLVSVLKKGKKQCKDNCCPLSNLADNNTKNLKDCKSFILNSSCMNLYNNQNEREDINKEIKYIKDSTMHLISIIEDFDFISHREAYQTISQNQINTLTQPQLKSPIGQSFIEMSRFRLSKIIKQCVSILQTKIDLSEKNIKVTTFIDENIPYQILSDYKRLKQVISNLLANAFKFTLMGEISITVRKDALNDNLVNFEISDTGMGFREDILQIIQEGKTQLLFGNINTGGNIYGCGIGLELVEKIISKIGKNLKIISQINKGSKITFSLHHEVDNRIEKTNTNDLKTYRSSNVGINEHVKTQYLKKNLPSSPVLSERKSAQERSFSIKTLKKSNFKEEIEEKIIQNLVKDKSDSSISLSNFKIFENNQDIFSNLEKDNNIPNLDLSLDYPISISDCKDETNKVSDFDENDKTVIINTILGIKKENICFGLGWEFPKNNKHQTIQKNVESFEYLSYKLENKRENNISINRENSKNENLIKIRILLVDDEKLIRQAALTQIKKFFKYQPNYKYEITECSDGVECLYKIYQGIEEGMKYDYIITDDSMNFMRGTAMIKTLNSLIEDNIMYRLKTFMVTSYEPLAIINTHGNICDGIITKPLTFENLKKIFSW